MEFVNQFVVPAPIDEAWVLLTDVSRIAPCLPGASVREVDGGYEGDVTVKVGPIKVGYAGVASFSELDESTRTMVLDAKGKENSGRGSAAAQIRVALAPEGAGRTAVQVTTDLQVTGKVAQFGRSAMADVGERIIGQFARNLEAMIVAGGGSPSTDTAGTAGGNGRSGRDAGAAVGAVPTVPSTSPAAGVNGAELDVLSLAAPLLKRALPSLVALVVGVVMGRMLGGLQRSRGPHRHVAGVHDPSLPDPARHHR